MLELVIELKVSPVKIADQELISISINMTNQKPEPVIKTVHCFKKYTKEKVMNSHLVVPSF